MRALVTGVAGFIGSTLARRLLEEGASVVGVDSLTDYYDRALKRRNATDMQARGLLFLAEDLLRLDLKPLLEGIDVVFHLAGQPGVRASWGNDFERYTERNVLATQTLLEAVRAQASPPRVVYASSSSVYGDAPQYPTRENDLPRPVSPYGVSKLAAEHLVTLYGLQFGIQTVSLRYFTVYVPRQRPDMAFSRFIDAALNQQPITVYGDGKQVRDFTYVDDVVQANLLAASASLSPGEVMNISGGSSVTVRDTIRLLEEIHGAPVPVRFEPRVVGDAQRTGGSNERAKASLGWRPTVSIAEGLSREYAYLAERRRDRS